MRIFVTGAAGFIGRAVVKELQSHGHQVVGLARNEKNTQALREAGVEPHAGDLEDPESLARGAQAADGVIHLAFIHDFSDFHRPTVVDRAAVQAMAKALSGTHKPLVIASGTLSLPKGTVATEHSEIDGQGHFAARAEGAKMLMTLSKEGGFKGIQVRLAPTVHDVGDWGYVPGIMRTARKNGYVGYIGDGTNRWPAVHRLDAAVLFRLAVEQGVDGASYHAVAEQSIQSKEIMAVIGKKLGLPPKSLTPEEAKETLGFLAGGIGLDNPVTSAWTQKQLGWRPTRPGLLEDIEQNYSAE